VKKKISFLLSDRQKIQRVREENSSQNPSILSKLDSLSIDDESNSLPLILDSQGKIQASSELLSSFHGQVQQSPTIDKGKLFANLDEQKINELIVQYNLGRRDFRSFHFAGLDLSGINLSHADLRSANFFNAELRCANLDYADLRGTNFKSANLKATSLNNCDLARANLTDTHLGHAILNGANLSEAIWERVNCHRTSLTGATLPDGSKWLLRTLAFGKELSLEELLAQRQRSLSLRKKLATFLVLALLVGGFELIGWVLSFASELF
jgi:hypothetical protein